MIENPKIQALAESLANAPRKDREKTMQAMELAYLAGRIDGAIENCDRLLGAKQDSPGGQSA